MSNSPEQKAIIRHTNKLVHYEIAKLSPIAQNLMALLFAMWTKNPQEQTKLDLVFVKEQLGLVQQRDSYLENIIINTGKEIVDKSFIAVKFDGGAVVGSLIYWFKINDQTQQLEVSTTSAFMDLFRKLKEGYTEYDFLTFYKIESKQAKNIYYLCRKNFKGQFTMNWTDFRRELGFKDSARSSNIIALAKKAVDYLVRHRYLATCQMIPIYGAGRGRPLAQIHLEYTFPVDTPQPVTVESAPAAQVPTIQKPESIPELIKEAQPAEPLPDAAEIQPGEILPTPEPEPFDPAALRPVTSEEARDAAIAALPKIEDVIAQEKSALPPDPFPAQPVKPEDELQRLELRCPSCGEPMVIRENGTTHAIFWACPQVWAHKCLQKTISIPAEIAEIYWKHKK